MRTEPAYNVKEVNGVKVVAWAPAETALSGSQHVNGKVITFDNAEALVLEDGEIAFGCTFPGCTYSHPTNPLMVASNHYVAEHEPRIPKEYGLFLDRTLRDLLDDLSKAEAAITRLMEQVERLEAERLTIGNRNTLKRLEIENKTLKEEIGKLSEVKAALAVFQNFGGK